MMLDVGVLTNPTSTSCLEPIEGVSRNPLEGHVLALLYSFYKWLYFLNLDFRR